ncbi:MAG TPA: nitroreductase [Anaerolineae bacterium]|nr:nitroreductase [Anaerolineae bacterium]
MDIFEAIYTRQSINIVKPDPVSRELIERILAAAVQAPNHYKVRPWRFVVLSGAARERLGAVMVESLRKRDPRADEDARARERSKPLRAPVVIAVGVDQPHLPKVVEIENVAATAAAVQNLLLAAHALGLAAKWRTGTPAYAAEVKAFLGFAPDQHLVGFIYLGYPEAEPTPIARPSHEDRTVWLDE